MKVPEIWTTSKGQGITVAVIDGGFNFEHPDLLGQLLPGKDFSGLPGGVGTSSDGHGTGIASLIAGSGKGMGGKGAFGLAPGARVLPLKIKNDSNAGRVATTEFFKQIGHAITYAADQGAKVINISQGGTLAGASEADMAAMTGAVSHAAAKGALVVASVGNSAQSGNPIEYPGALPGVVGVGAVDRNGWVAPESEQGPQVDVAAPGVDMYNACIGPSGYCKTHGTSDAAAIVSASAALLWAVHPEWSANQVVRVLINTAGKPTDGSDRNDIVGYGIVRPRVALTEPGDPGPADVYPIPERAVGESSPAPSSAAPAVPAAPVSPAGSSGVPGEGKAVGEAAGSGGVVPVVAAVAGGLVLVAGGVAFVVVRRRSARPGAAGVPPSGNPYVR
ncbi:type VII secretion-associated serine protease mycosin [Streptomyces sp. BE303]|uniref:type VII secretion-associated serine protease mycosin n=1 Tax=Streptomyces sp. BE303 TaxID=3002528 RepID=UPI002E77994E|nr:type VII secretion-associated serine protease mycosin [Streptomyces sp. BE303]MED7955494.1 type VII secretion-associated serine protease mycosin [Streptomyces sp. BE303]